MNGENMCVGIWIDHNKAIIISDDHNGRQSVFRMESNVEGHFRLSGGARTACPWGPTDVAAEGRPERRRMHHLNRFYRDLIERIEDAGSLYVFGPGEAKGEFGKEIRKCRQLAPKLVAVETADKMTERQVAAHVRQVFIARRKPVKSTSRR